MAKMSGGDVDVEPYLDSRNTKGYGTALKFSNLEVANVSESETVQKWLGYAEVVKVYGGHRNKIWWKLGRWMDMLLPGAGCPGEGRMSEWGRMSGLYGPDVGALDPGTNGMNTARRG